MEPAPKLPLSPAELPAAVKRFCNPDGPTAGRMMAAKGLVPVSGSDQVTMLAQLGSDANDEVKTTAIGTLMQLPDALLGPACAADLHPAILHFLGITIKNEEMLAILATNRATPHITVVDMARGATDMLCERIAINETRLLLEPTIIEALYKNRSTRMSTADRIIDFAARNQLELPGVATYKAHVEALKGQLIPEASDEPLPQDANFDASLLDGEGAIETDKYTGQEEVKEKFKPLNLQIMNMSKAEKLRLATVGGLPARAILIRDNVKQIAMATIQSPQILAPEAADIAKSKEVSEEILRFVGNKKEWIKSGEVKHNLVFNGKTPIGVSMKFISHLRLDELKKLAKSRNVSAQIKGMASQWLARRQKT